MDNLLSFLGLAKKAGKLAIGEEPVGASCRARDCRVLLLAKDAAGPTCRRARHFADAGQCLLIQLPFEKDALGRSLGRSSCAMLAVEDIGFADAIVRRLAKDNPQYQEAADRLQLKAQRAAERREEQQRHEKNLRRGIHPRKEEKPQPEAPAPQEEPAPAPAPQKRPAPTGAKLAACPVRQESRDGARPKPTQGRSGRPAGKPAYGVKPTGKPTGRPTGRPAAKPAAIPDGYRKRAAGATSGTGIAGQSAAKRYAGSRPVKKGKGSTQPK